jgi:hypothetical protein
MGKLINFNGWIVEEGEPTLQQFYEMNAEQKNAYIISILDKPEDERSNKQKHIVKFYNITPPKQKNFYTLDVEE